MKLLLSFPSSRKLTAALLWVLRLAQTPFAAVVWRIEAMASRVEIILEAARANHKPDGGGAGGQTPAPSFCRVGPNSSSGPQPRDCIAQPGLASDANAGEPEPRAEAVLKNGTEP